VVVEKLGKRVVIARTPVTNVSKFRRVSEFVARYARWSVLQRQIVGLPVYLAELLLNPVFFASIGLALMRDQLALSLWAICSLSKAMLDCFAAQKLRGGAFQWSLIPFVPVKDIFAVASWAYGLLNSTVTWRGNRLLVLRGSQLQPIAAGWPSPLEGKASRG